VERIPLKLFTIDFNWVREKVDSIRASMAHELVVTDPQAYVDWHIDLGCNVIFQQAYTFNGCAWYPSRLGPCVPEPGTRFLEEVLACAHNAGLPFHSYFCVGQDLLTCATRRDWHVPTTASLAFPGSLAPESGWTDLLCRRIEEFVKAYPVDALVFDWFYYGSTKPDFHLQPAPFVKKPFEEIIGRPLPERAEEITPEESLKYKREVLARQFYRIRDAVKSTRPNSAIYFNVPYLTAAEALWIDHPMLQESDYLIAECTKLDVVDWLLSIRKPNQRVFTVFSGRLDDEDLCDPSSWSILYEKGCDFWGYAWPKPPGFLPGPWYDKDIQIVREAFHSLPG